MANFAIVLVIIIEGISAMNWVQVKIVWLDLQGECFEHSCGDPKLRFIVREPSIEHSFCWPIAIGALLDPIDSYFVPTRAALNFSMEIVGQDPIYRFPRTCDVSDPERHTLAAGRAAVFSRGRCFNATVILQTSGDFGKPSRGIVNDSSSASDAPDGASAQSRGPAGSILAALGPVPAWVVFLLGAVNLALLVLIALIFWASKSFAVRKRGAGSASGSDCSPEFEVRVSKAVSQETKYDLPWEHDYHYASSCLHKNNFEKNERGVIVVRT